MMATLTYDEHLLARRGKGEEATTSPTFNRRVLQCSRRRHIAARVYTSSILGELYSLGGHTSNCIVALAEDHSEQARASVTMPSISSQINAIIDTFSLTISQAARVLGVTRPTVYAWKKSEDSCSDVRTDHKRLMQVYDLAVEWMSYNRGPMGDQGLMPFRDDQKSIIGSLSSKDLTPEIQAKIRERMRVIARPEKGPGLFATRGTNWREAFERMGVAGPTPEQQDAIQDDNLSRLRHEY